jgi:hypothetical protein
LVYLRQFRWQVQRSREGCLLLVDTAIDLARKKAPENKFQGSKIL